MNKSIGNCIQIRTIVSEFTNPGTSRGTCNKKDLLLLGGSSMHHDNSPVLYEPG